MVSADFGGAGRLATGGHMGNQAQLRPRPTYPAIDLRGLAASHMPVTAPAHSQRLNNPSKDTSGTGTSKSKNMVINDRISTAHNVAVQDENSGLIGGPDESFFLRDEASGERGPQSHDHQGREGGPDISTD